VSDRLHRYADGRAWAPPLRAGVPDDKSAVLGVPILTPEGSSAVLMLIIPPKALQDASRELIERYVDEQGRNLLRGIASEIYRSFTASHMSAVGARNIADQMNRHADALVAHRGATEDGR
jgi:hypothetical protein